jgi:glycosyltransferase involved in cell wall biosynthesis
MMAASIASKARVGHAARLRVLVITDSLPFPPRNGKERPVAQFIDGFARDFECDLLVSSTGRADDFDARRPQVPETVRRVARIGTRGRSGIQRAVEELLFVRPAFYQSGFEREQVREHLGGRDYDFVWVSPVGCIGLVDYAREQGWLRGSRIGIGLNDVKTTLYLESLKEAMTGRLGLAVRRFFRGVRLPWIMYFERRLLRRSDLVVQTELEETRALRVVGERHRARIVVAQNGRDETLFRATPAGAESHDVLYMTQLSGGRARESTWFLDHVWPLIRDRDPAAVLHLVGTPPKKGGAFYRRSLERVVVHGYVDDLVQLYSAMRVAVLPISHSTGLINRLLDALTAGVPVVGSPGPLRTVTGLRFGLHAIAASQPDQFASAVVSLLNDQPLWDRVHRAGRQLAETQPTWSESVQRVARAIRATCDERAHVAD